MKLPNVSLADVPPAKITNYLLSELHPVGRHKAAFFLRFGYTLDQWQRLAADLLEHAAAHEVADSETSPFGHRYVIEGIIQAPDGRQPRIRTVWFIETDQVTPRLVTAYPLDDDDD